MSFSIFMLTLLVWVIAFFAFDHYVLKGFFARKVCNFLDAQEKKNGQ